MARQTGVPITGTIGNVTFYKRNGKYFARKKSSLTRKRVRKSKAFRKTMMYAGWLVRASKIASRIYRKIPPRKRSINLYRKITGEAMLLIRAGMADKDVAIVLQGRSDEWNT